MSTAQQEDFVYAVVNRTIEGQTKRYIECAASRTIDVDDSSTWKFLDSWLQYDGRNTSEITMELQSEEWDEGDTVTVEASDDFFEAGDVGNVIVVRAGDDVVRVTITEFTDDQHVDGTVNVDVPVSLQATAVTDWDRAVDQVLGLEHLEGESVGILADGTPFTGTVTGGQLATPLTTPASVITVGLPYNSDMETLDIDQDGTQIRGNQKKIIRLGALLDDTIATGLKIGPDSEYLETYRQDDPEATETVPTAQFIEGNIEASWRQSGRVFMRQDKPLPVKVLSIMPQGDLGG
jgi:hypothetical protein